MPSATPFSSRAADRLARVRVFAAVVAVALALPLLLSDAPGRADLGLPRIYGGDEPHYMVMLSSLVDDGDLDLGNQYEAARVGGWQAGRNFAGLALDHHTVWFAPDGARWPWYRVFAMPAPGARGAAAVAPRRLPGVDVDFAGIPERSSHPAGLPLLLAPVLRLLRGTHLVEPAALFLTALVTLAMAFFTRRLFRVFTRDDVVVHAATLVAVLGTPLWAYGRIFVTEPWLACCAAGALALALEADRYALAGVLVALGMQMKPPFALVGVPLMIDVAWRRDMRRGLALGVPLAIGAALVLASNSVFFGAPTRAAQAWESGSFVAGALGLLFSWDHGLFVFAPAAIVAALGWPALIRRARRPAWIVLATALGYVALMALWRDWRGGYSYGPRLIVPVVPLLMAGLVPWIEAALEPTSRRSPVARRAVIAACALSIVISAVGATASFTFWASHPLVEPFFALAR